MVALEVCRRRHLDEVSKPGRVLGQQSQMIGCITALAAGEPFGAVSRRDIGFVADDGIEASVLAGTVELDRAVQVAVVGQRDGVHAIRLGVFDQFGYAIGAVEQAVVAVAM